MSAILFADLCQCSHNIVPMMTLCKEAVFQLNLAVWWLGGIGRSQLWKCAGWGRLHASFSRVPITQCSLNERFLHSAFCEALCSVHAVAQVICSDALKIHLANQMIWPYSRKLGMTVWPNFLSRVQCSSQVDLEKCCIPSKSSSCNIHQNSFESILALPTVRDSSIRIKTALTQKCLLLHVQRTHRAGLLNLIAGSKT